MRPRNYQVGYPEGGEGLFEKVESPREKPLIIVPTGVDYDLKPSRLEQNHSPYAQNCQFRRGYLSPRPGLIAEPNPPSGGFDENIAFIGEAACLSAQVVLTGASSGSLYTRQNYTNAFSHIWNYSSGSATTDGSATVEGSATTWTTNVAAGDRFKINSSGVYRTVQSVTDNDTLVLTAAYPTSHAAAAYTIERRFATSTANPFWLVEDVANSRILFWPGGNIIYYSAGVTIVDSAIAAGTVGFFAVSHGERLIILRTNNDFNRIAWSVVGDFLDFTGTGSGYQDFKSDGKLIMGGSVINDCLVVYKERSIHVGRRTGIATAPYSFEKAVDGVGLYLPGTLRAFGEYDIFGGAKDFYTFNLQGLKPIGRKFRRYFFSNYNPTYYKNVHGVVRDDDNELQLYYPKGASTTANKCLVVDLETGELKGEWDLADDGRGFTIDHQLRSPSQIIATRTYISSGISLYYQSDTTADDNAVDFTFEWRSKEIRPPLHKRPALYRVWVEYYCQPYSGQAANEPLLCALSADGGDNWSSDVSADLVYANPNLSKIAYFDFLNTYDDTLMIRLRCTTGALFQIIQIALEGAPTGEEMPA